MDPPLPIPNRTVKRRYADDSAYFMCESRSPPGSPKYKALPAQQRRGLCAFQTEIAPRYKALADIERGFRVLKSEIEIAPVFHPILPS